MILGAMMLVEAPIPEMRVAWPTLVAAALVMAAGVTALLRMVLRAQRLVAVTGEVGMIGQPGEAVTDLSPEGWVRVAGERWKAVAEEAMAAGQRVQVAAVEGLTLRVRKRA
jgi:membrane-bound serine protease (ClpP class)